MTKRKNNRFSVMEKVLSKNRQFLSEIGTYLKGAPQVPVKRKRGRPRKNKV